MTRFAWIAVATPIAVPPIVFVLSALTEGMSPLSVAAATAAQYMSGRQNLLIVGTLGYVPLALLPIALWIHRRFRGQEPVRTGLAWGGLIALALVLVWVNASFWPLYLPDRVYPGFPHGLEFVIGPLFFAPVAMLLGMAAGAGAARVRHARRRAPMASTSSADDARG